MWIWWMAKRGARPRPLGTEMAGGDRGAQARHWWLAVGAPISNMSICKMVVGERGAVSEETVAVGGRGACGAQGAGDYPQ